MAKELTKEDRKSLQTLAKFGTRMAMFLDNASNISGRLSSDQQDSLSEATTELMIQESYKVLKKIKRNYEID